MRRHDARGQGTLREDFFTKSPQAYFIDNLQEQAAGRRTPPDWWRELRKEEERRRWQADRDERAATSATDIRRGVRRVSQDRGPRGIRPRHGPHLPGPQDRRPVRRRREGECLALRPHPLRQPLPRRAPGVER